MTISSFPFSSLPAEFALRMFNALLRREDWARARLSPYAGKSLRLSLGAVSFNAAITSEGILQASDQAVLPDVTITLPAHRRTEILTLWREGRLDQIGSIMHIEGDAGLAQRVSDLTRDLRWDIEDELSERVGDIAAVRLMAGLRALGGGLRTAGRHMRENVSEYLGEESGLLVQRHNFEGWRAQVDGLADRLDGLSRRMDALDRQAGRTC